jgi:acetyl-CoA acyltransferase 2
MRPRRRWLPVESATDVDQVIFGNVQQTSADAIYLARHIGLRSGVPIPAPALTLNRLCGSGFQAVVSAAEQIVLGAATTVLCGGTESMSQAPHVLRGARWGWPLGKAPAISDTLVGRADRLVYRHADGDDRREAGRAVSADPGCV